MPLLKTSNFSVEERIDDIVALSRGSEFEGMVITLADYVDDIEYDEALAVAESILAKLGASS